MFRAIACAVALSALSLSAHAQDLRLDVIQETMTLKPSDILSAEQAFSQHTNQPIVRVKLAPDAAKRFGEITGRNIRKVMQLVSGECILTAPVIMSAITGGEIVIEGNLTVEGAVELAKKLKPKP
jgi:preprotein translocase subunit SecD